MTDQRLPNPLLAAASLPRGSWVILRLAASVGVPAYAKRLRQLCRQRHLSFLIAGDVGLAARLDADGLHLPEAMARHGSLSAALSWIRQNPNRLLTVAAHDGAALARAADLGADAAILSPVFATKSHPQSRPLGVLRFRLMARQARCKVIGLGGIDRQRSRQLKGARIAGLAGISAFCL